MAPPSEREHDGKPLGPEALSRISCQRDRASTVIDEGFKRRVAAAARRNEEAKRMKNNAHPEVAADRQSTSDNPSSWPGTTSHTTGKQPTVDEASQRSPQVQQEADAVSSQRSPQVQQEADAAFAGVGDIPGTDTPPHSAPQPRSYQQSPTEGSSYSDAQQRASQERQQDLPNPTTEQSKPRGEDGPSQATATARPMEEVEAGRLSLSPSSPGRDHAADPRHSASNFDERSTSQDRRLRRLSTNDVGNRRTVAEMLKKFAENVGTPSHDRFDISAFRESKANVWSEIPRRNPQLQKKSREPNWGAYFENGLPGEVVVVDSSHEPEVESSTKRNSFLEDVKSPTTYHTGDLPSIPADDSKPGSDELVQTLDHGIIRGFVPEETPYGSDKPAASSLNANAKRPRARFQLGTSDDSDDGDQSLPTNSIAIAPHQAERERRKSRGRKSELRVHPSDDQTDRDVPSLPEDWEFKYDDDGNRDKPSPTPSPRAPSYYHASGTTPARPATRAHFRHGSSSSGAFDFSPRPPASSPRYTSMGQYAIATGNASSSGVTEFQVPKPGDDMTDYINPWSPSLSITPEESRDSRHPSWERYVQEKNFPERANPLRRQNHVDFPTGLPHETATVPRSYTCAQCNRVFDQLHKLNHHIRYHELTPAEAQARSLLLQNDIDPERLNSEQFRAFSEASQQVQVKMIKQSHIRYDVDSNGNIIPIPGGPTDSRVLEQFRAFNEANPQVQDNVLKTYNVNLQKHDQQQQADRPTYTRMSLRHLDIDTLIAFKVDWEYDPEPGYILIKRWVPEWEQDQLWAHTHQIRLVRGRETDKTENDQFTLVPNKGDLDVGNTDMPSEITAAVNPADQNPPCNTLYVGNLPADPSAEELKTLKTLFSKQRGYKRLCFESKGNKLNRHMCLVEFEDVSYATKALNDLYGMPLGNSTKGGIRLSFSKIPLGVRYNQNPTQSAAPRVLLTFASTGQKTAPRNDMFSQRLQAANDQHLRPEDPAVSGTSPFRHRSPLAPMSTGSHQDFSPAEPFLEGKIPIKDFNEQTLEPAQGLPGATDPGPLRPPDYDHSARASQPPGGKELSAKSEEGGGEDRAAGKKRPKRDVDEGFKFACPFLKHNPAKYENQRTCCGPGWDDVHRVKEHLFRRHTAPKFVCHRCNETFRTDDQYKTHQRTDTPCPLREFNPSDGFDETKEKQLRTRRSSQLSERQKWEDIYAILFPDDLIPSPYFDKIDVKNGNRVIRYVVEAMGREGENEEVLQARVGDVRSQEEVLQARVGDLRRAQEEAKVEIETAEADAERAARERTVAANADHVPPDKAAGKPENRACITCREQRNRCVRVPAHPRCVRCERFGRVCRITNVPSADHDIFPTSTTDEQTLKRAEGFLGDKKQPVPVPSPYDGIDSDPPPFYIEGYKLDPKLLDVQSPSMLQNEALQDDMTQDGDSLMIDLDDVLLIKNNGTTYRAQFPPYSIANGQVLVHHLRTRVQALMALSDHEAEDIRLVCRGQVMDHAELPILLYDVRQNSEIMVIMGESFPLPSINDQLGGLNWSDKDPLELQPQAYSVPGSSLDYRDNAPTDSGYASLPRQDKVGGADETCGNVQSAEGPSKMAQLDLEDSLDAGTVYSDDKSESSGSMTQRYISEFVDHFLGKIRHQMIRDNAQRLSSCLPDMLKAFALKFGQTSSTQGHREVMYFVHKNRESIAQSIQDRLRAEDNQAPVNSRPEDPSDMSIEEKMLLWDRKEASQGFERETDNVADLEDEIDTKELARYQSLIMDSPAFDWLLGSVQRELCLDDTMVEAMTQIRQQILEALPAARHISRKRAIPSVRVSFNVQWDPLSFIEEQGYDGDFQDVFGKIITLTGSTTDVQAVTCEQYLCQTWPSTGKHMLRILQGTMGRQSTSSASASERRTYIFPDNTRIAAFHENKTLTLEASGTTYSMAEIGEQLGWLVAAIRASRYETEMSLCRPQIRQFQAGAGPSQPFSCEIGVDWMAGPSGKESGNGRCWHSMFNNPAIVWGYPIPRRQPLERGTGLEIPLAMLMALADATTVSEFDNKTFIKGFSAMLIPTNQVDGIILWHLLSNEDGSRISYIDSRALGIQHISPTGLREARHILGWTTKAKNHTGSPDANYDIKWSGLGKPRERHAWEKVVISGGDNGISLGASIVIGKKDRAISAGGQGGYASRLRFIAKQYVVMYDLSDRRAWLVDGLSALLHLVRASLEHDEKDVFNSVYLYKKGQLQEASSARHGADAAAAVLLNPANYSLRLYNEDCDTWDEETEQQKAVGHGTEKVKEMVSKKKVTYYCLRDRVLEIWSMLEKMIDHLNNVQSETGVGFRLRGTPRNILEGFDFMDVATNNAPVRPHMVKLNVSESGRGWTDLLRSIQAVTLFGKGFGDLITPATDMSGNHCDNCGYAVNLPVGKDYMGTCVNLVEQILTTRGNTETVPWCLADDIYWHTPGSLFEPCRCSGTSKRTPCDRAQVLVPSSYPHLWGRRFASPKWLESQGAVMFSHTWKVPFRNNNNNNNNTANNKPEPDSLEVPDRDSGLGTSLDSLSARSDLASGSTDGVDTRDDMPVDGSTSSSVILPSQVDVNCDMTDDTLPPGCTSVQMSPPDCNSGSGPGEATPAACRKRKREMVSDMVGSIKKKFAKPPPGMEMEQLSQETREDGSVDDPSTRMQR